MPTYLTHDNGGRPFKVVVQKTQATIYKRNRRTTICRTPSGCGPKLVSTFASVEMPLIAAPGGRLKIGTQRYTHVVGKYQLSAAATTRVWVGRSSTTPNHKFVGNSIVLQNGTRCVFIGHEVYEFSLAAGETIQAYYSVVGNSDVPYPVLRGTKNAYFMLDKKYVALDQLNVRRRTKAAWENLYGEFYNFTAHQQQQTHKMKRLKVVCRSPFS